MIHSVFGGPFIPVMGIVIVTGLMLLGAMLSDDDWTRR